MDINKRDIEFLRELVKQKLTRLKEEGSNVFRPGVALLSAEEKYEEYLKELITKLK